MPKFKQVLKPIIIGFVTSLVINLAIGILTIVLTGKANAHPAVAKESVLQFSCSPSSLPALPRSSCSVASCRIT